MKKYPVLVFLVLISACLLCSCERNDFSRSKVEDIPRIVEYLSEGRQESDRGINITGHENPTQAENAAFALLDLMISEEEALEKLLELTNGTDKEVAQDAFRALRLVMSAVEWSEFEYEEIMSSLFKQMQNHPDAEIRYQSTWCLLCIA